MAGPSPPDPFALLGVPRTAGADDLRAARRRLAMDEHPDRGGSPARMQAINVAFEQAMALLAEPPPAVDEAPAPPPNPPPADAPRPSGRRWVERDEPSFVIEALPPEAFEALLVVATWMGEVLVDDPPYFLEAHVNDPAECWCRLELLPEAGASTVILTVAGIEGTAPPVEVVRDRWIENLNQLGASPE